MSVTARGHSNLGHRDHISLQAVRRLPAANLIFLGSWMVSQTEASSPRRCMANLGLCAHSPPESLRGLDLGSARDAWPTRGCTLMETTGTWTAWNWEVHGPLLLLSSHSGMSDYLRPDGLQPTRFPCASPTPRPCSNSHPLSQWCHPTILSSVISFSSCPQSLPASESFQMSQLCASGSQSIGASDSASVLPMYIQDWFPLGFTGLISLLSKELRVFSNTQFKSISFSALSLL